MNAANEGLVWVDGECGWPLQSEDGTRSTMDSLCKLALECIDFNRKNRPKTMRDVLLRLHAIQSAWCAQLSDVQDDEHVESKSLEELKRKIAEMEQMLSEYRKQKEYSTCCNFPGSQGVLCLP